MNPSRSAGQADQPVLQLQQPHNSPSNQRAGVATERHASALASASEWRDPADHRVGSWVALMLNAG